LQFRLDVTRSGPPGDGRIVCRYCDLESAVSHASERECIDELQREVTRLKERLSRGRLGDIAVVQQ
jgi:hypothetical protein